MKHSPCMARRKRSLAVAFLILATLLTLSLALEWGSVAQWSSGGIAAGWLLAGISGFLGLTLFQTAWGDQRSLALIRVDWFLPAIKRTKESNPAKSIGGRLLRRLTPGMHSDWNKKKRGRARTLLRKLGISWVASPLRRFSQAICLLLFCWLFFYVCWPYHAKPTPIQSIGNLTYQSFDQQSGAITFLIDQRDAMIGINDSIFVRSASDTTNVDGESDSLAEFYVLSDSGDSIELASTTELSPHYLDLVTGMSSFQVYTATDIDPSAWPSHYANSLARKEFLPAESFLMLDPLVSLSTAIASRSWVWSLGCAAAILIVCVFIPRGFCGYLCPLGTTIDLFDWAVGRRTKRFRVSGDGWWVHIKYYLLAGILVAAMFGVLVSGFFSAIPVITRGMLFIVDPLQNGWSRGWHLVPSLNAGHFVSILLFSAVLALGLLRPRFWCKYVCPSGAVFSLGNLFRVTERKVESSCIHCNKCVEICPFDAIKPDFTTRVTDCTLCQTCAGVCPTHAIKFVERSNVVELKVINEPPTGETELGRRGFLSLAAGSAAAIAGGSAVAIGTKTFGAKSARSLPVINRNDDPRPFLPVRPPGSVPEQKFLEMCIRCGECFKACPNNVLQPESFQQGLEGLWTPMVNANWAGCESSCNACGQVCPTGAIRALPIEEKKAARMGLAIVNESTCLPYAGTEACDLCVQECQAAGYDAIEYTQVGAEVDSEGRPVEGTGFAAPVVLADKCVGCGLCQTRCFAINVKDKHLLAESAIIIEAGEGREDRLMSGSYVKKNRQAEQRSATEPGTTSTLVDSTTDQRDTPGGVPPLPEPDEGTAPPGQDDPFGVQPLGSERVDTDDNEESPF
ncbi:4Fe-4S binding protein [Roseiconus lacunae]|uniref:4Fe-4S binding protein n=1 Tax=Roseiconus lacunae TaxID=2605694 RepID=A0ABT7PDZ5_9BACT|nr:4Fe-4S binding protein [Roseiconus lacunae]MDM4014706.1 4Fe-4S binding protein [Roseiconus lacunae]